MSGDSSKRQGDGAEKPPRVLEPEVVLEDRPSDPLPATDEPTPDIPFPIDDEYPLEGDVSVLPSANTNLVTYDPLSAYLAEIKRYRPLTREEEQQLVIKYRDHKDLKAAYRLISGNLWLVVKIAREYERAARNLLDLIQEGNMGLMEAVKNFDPYRGVRLPSYAVWWIRAYIVRYLIANWRLVKIGTTQNQRKLFFNLKKERDKLEREGFAPSAKLLAERLDVSEEEVVEMEQRLGSSEVSFDAPLQDDGDATLAGVLPAPHDDAETALAKKEFQLLLRSNLDAFRNDLSSKEQRIFDKRLLAEEKATLQELADEIGVSGERVRQLEVKLRERLRRFLEDRLLQGEGQP